MEDIIATVKTKPCFSCLNAATDEMIKRATQELRLVFTDEYRKLVSTYGAVSYYGHELTGVCSVPALDVVTITNSERALVRTIPASWYVIERAGIDGITIWQDAETGYIYRSRPLLRPKKIAESLSEYISSDIYS